MWVQQRLRSDCTCVHSFQSLSGPLFRWHLWILGRPVVNFEGLDHCSQFCRLNQFFAGCTCRRFSQDAGHIFSIVQQLYLGAERVLNTGEKAFYIFYCAIWDCWDLFLVLDKIGFVVRTYCCEFDIRVCSCIPYSPGIFILTVAWMSSGFFLH